MALLRSTEDDDELARVKNIVNKFFSKCLHVIHESRCASTCHDCNISTENSYTEGSSKKDRWFNLALSDRGPCSEVRNIMEQNSRQMVVDLVMLHQPVTVSGEIRRDGCMHLETEASSSSLSGRNKKFRDMRGGRVIERWVMHFEVKRGGKDSRSRNKSGLKGSSGSSWAFYKKCVVMLRSLYLMLRLLPAYKIYRDLMAYNKPCDVSLVHYISSSSESFPREMESEMRRYVFEPVESCYGRVSLSVVHLPPVQNFRVRPTTHQMFSNLILDYFGVNTVHHVSGAPVFLDSGKVSNGSEVSAFVKKLSSTESGAIQAQLPVSATSSIYSSSRETSANGCRAERAAKCECLPSQLTSNSPLCSGTRLLEAPSLPELSPTRKCHSSDKASLPRFSICPLHPLSNIGESGDLLSEKLSNNAVLGSLVDEFQNAAPLRPSSTFQPDVANPSASSPGVKTSLDAFRELEVHIDMKKRLLERSSTLIDSDNHNTVT